MNEDEAYLDVAKRYIESCEEHISNGINIQEVVGFKSYHAFESIAGAYNSHYGHAVPRGHARKLNTFVINTRRNHLANSRAIAAQAILLSSMRNKYLYPEKTGTNFKRPQDQISLTDAKQLVRKVKGIVRQVEGII